jgi:hypothetical protein
MWKVGTFNSTGKKYQRHYDIWTINKLQEVKCAPRAFVSGVVEIPDWTNPNLYQPSGETFGIQPISRQIQAAAGLVPFHHALDAKRSHSFLAARQQTRIAVLPIHTTPEKALFSQLMKGQTSGKPKWGQVVIEWNRAAEDNADREIYYKVCRALIFLCTPLIDVNGASLATRTSRVIFWRSLAIKAESEIVIANVIWSPPILKDCSQQSSAR